MSRALKVRLVKCEIDRLQDTRRAELVGSLSNYDVDHNDNFKKQ